MAGVFLCYLRLEISGVDEVWQLLLKSAIKFDFSKSLPYCASTSIQDAQRETNGCCPTFSNRRLCLTKLHNTKHVKRNHNERRGQMVQREDSILTSLTASPSPALASCWCFSGAYNHVYEWNGYEIYAMAIYKWKYEIEVKRGSAFFSLHFFYVRTV